jgi:hypothetical protein
LTAYFLCHSGVVRKRGHCSGTGSHENLDTLNGAVITGCRIVGELMVIY